MFAGAVAAVEFVVFYVLELLMLWLKPSVAPLRYFGLVWLFANPDLGATRCYTWLRTDERCTDPQVCVNI